jgi:hypothetical protein
MDGDDGCCTPVICNSPIGLLAVNERSSWFTSVPLLLVL